jgi:hypothetical protein
MRRKHPLRGGEDRDPVPESCDRFVRRSDDTDARSEFEQEAGAQYMQDGAVAVPAEPKDPGFWDLQPFSGVRKEILDESNST